MHYTVYKITNTVNGKVYIGAHATKNPNDSYMGSGTLINRAINKYGKDKFRKKILYDFDNSKAMYEAEARIVTAEFVASENTYNLKEGGLGGWQYAHANYWTPEKRAKAQRGKKLSQETKDKISKIHKGRTVSQETKNKMSKAHKGKTFSSTTLEKMSKAKKGKKLSKEHRENMSKAHQNRKKATCPHCNKTVPIANYTQWHGDNCKLKKE